MKFFREHWLGLIISILIGLVIAAPPFIWRFSEDYQGVDLLKTNTEGHYTAQIQEVYDGRPLLGNPFMAGELKETPYLFPPLGPNLMAGLGKIFGLDAVQAVMVLRFFFTGLSALAVYYFSFLLTGRRLIGLVAAPFVMLGYALVDPGHILELFGQKPWSQELTFIDYGRPINPQLSSLFFFGYLVFFWQFLHKEKFWIYGILSGLLLGLSFYVYLYTWSFIFALNGSLFLVYLFQKDWTKAKKVFYLSVAAGLLGIPYFIHTINLTSHPFYAESSARFGFFRSRALELSRLVIGGFVLFLLSFKLFAKETRLFFLAFFITALSIVNEQVITGLYIFNHHWHWYYNTPLVIIFLTVFLFMFLERFLKKDWLSSFLAVILLFIFFHNGLTTQRLSYNYNLPAVKNEQNYASLFEWINGNASRDDIFVASREVNDLIPVLTGSNVYYYGTGIYALVSTDQLTHAYLVYTYLDGVNKAQIRDFLEANRNNISYFVYGYAYRLKKGVCLGCFPDEVIEKMVNKYQNINDQNFVSFIKQYPADYLIWDKLNKPDWQIEKFGLAKLTETASYAVYALNP